LKSIRVIVADDHPATRAGVRAALERSGFTVCAEVANGPAAVEAAIRERPDICLLDIHMPGSGIAAAAEISAQVPETAIIMLTVSQADEDLFAALRAGASGYLLKDTNPERLPLALEGVLRGESALPRVLVGRLIEEFRDREHRRRIPFVTQGNAKLTSREWEVLELLREGLSTAEIADRLYVTRVTVRSHIAAVLRKLDVSDRVSALKLFEDGP
jgi:DNA-binding NarL/FixJ family response regulator